MQGARVLRNEAYMLVRCNDERRSATQQNDFLRSRQGLFLLIKDHRPYFIKKAYLKFQRFYAARFLKPHFESLGKGFHFMKPWHVEIFGSSIELGDYATVIATPDKKIRLSVWSEKKDMGRIKIGSFCLICPGVRIGSAYSVSIGDNCMIASSAYITDSDWHDIYDRVSTGKSRPVNN